MSTVVRDKQDKDELFEKNQKLVFFILNRKYPTFVRDEDIIQAGMMGLWKACISFDPQIATFSTYATRCIDNEIRMEFRRRSRDVPECGIVSLEEEIRTDREGSLTIQDVIPDESDYYESADTRALVLQLRSYLRENDRKVFDLLARDLTQSEIADCLGTSRSNVSRIVARIRKRLEQVLSQQNRY